MEPNTTTEPATQEPGVDPSTQPVEQPATAVTTSEPEPTSTEPESPAEVTEPASAANSSTDDDLTDYWAKKGIDISTPEGQAKAAKSYREAEKALSQKSQKASQLEKQLQDQPVEIDSDNPLVQDLANEVVQMKRASMVKDFTAEVNLTAEQEQTMAQYLTDNPDKAKLVNAGYLSLKDVYGLSGAASTDPAVLKQAGGKEALENLRDKQLATAPGGNASTATAAPSVDPILSVLTSD